MNQSLVMLGKEEYEQILRSVVIFDYLLSKNHGRTRRGINEVSSLQQRLFDEAGSLGIKWTEEEKEQFGEQCLRELDSFVSVEAWDELAWWIAEREYHRRLAKAGPPRRGDADAEDLIIHRYYHEIVDEFERHGIANLEIAGLELPHVSPETVRAALAQFKKETLRKT